MFYIVLLYVYIHGWSIHCEYSSFIEMACEVSYPVAEGLTAGFLMMIINFTATVFLLINLIPDIGTAWMNWWVTTIPVVTVPLLLMFRVKYQRVDIDTGAKSQQQTVA